MKNLLTVLLLVVSLAAFAQTTHTGGTLTFGTQPYAEQYTIYNDGGEDYLKLYTQSKGHYKLFIGLGTDTYFNGTSVRSTYNGEIKFFILVQDSKTGIILREYIQF